MADSRFERLHTDPRFRRPHRRRQKLSVDDRLSSLFHSSESRSENSKRTGLQVDKYGRKVKATQEQDDLRRLYSLGTQEGQSAVPDLARGSVLLESSDDEDEGVSDGDLSSDDTDAHEVITLGGSFQSHSYRRTLSDVDVDLDESSFAELDAQAEAYTKTSRLESPSVKDITPATHRFAVVNLDWDHVRAAHLYQIFSSALVMSTTVGGENKEHVHALQGNVLNVRVYPSEYGKKRMAEEDKEGPPPEIFKTRTNLEVEDINEKTVYETNDGVDYDEDALRAYQLDRLRYHYAIVTCDTAEAASHVVSELQGTELERSANVFDLSFVPDDMEFDQEYRDEATALPDSTNYMKLDFSTNALRHSKVRLAWDDDDVERSKLTRRALTRKEIEEVDFRAYIASSESEDEAELCRRKSAADLRASLLGGKDDNLPEGWGRTSHDEANAMEITFTPALSGVNGVDSDTENTLEHYMRKQREKRKRRKGGQSEPNPADDVQRDNFFDSDSYGTRRETPIDSHHKLSNAKRKVSSGPSSSRGNDATSGELALVVQDDDHIISDRRHFDMKAAEKAERTTSQRRKKRKVDADGQARLNTDLVVNVDDPRFTALHQDPAFAIDPSHPHFKKTKGMAALLEARNRLRETEDPEVSQKRPSKVVRNEDMESLVARIKHDSQDVPKKPKRKRKF